MGFECALLQPHQTSVPVSRNCRGPTRSTKAIWRAEIGDAVEEILSVGRTALPAMQAYTVEQGSCLIFMLNGLRKYVLRFLGCFLLGTF